MLGMQNSTPCTWSSSYTGSPAKEAVPVMRAEVVAGDPGRRVCQPRASGSISRRTADSSGLLSKSEQRELCERRHLWGPLLWSGVGA